MSRYTATRTQLSWSEVISWTALASYVHATLLPKRQQSFCIEERKADTNQTALRFPCGRSPETVRATAATRRAAAYAELRRVSAPDGTGRTRRSSRLEVP